MPRAPGAVKTILGTTLKQLGEWFYPHLPYGGGLFLAPPRAVVDYSAEVGNGLLSSIVMPVVQWLMRAFPEAPLVVRDLRGDEWEVVDRHPLVALVDRPNPFYPGTVLWMVTLTDWTWFGESYWRILRQRGGLPGELWWLPPWSVEPKWPADGSAFISHYEFRPEIGTTLRLELDEVLHFRHGLDPWNPRHGLPPLRAVVREIWTDAEATTWVGALLRNMGIPGLIVSPKGEATMSPDEVERIKAYVMGRFTGEQRGQPMVMGAPTQVDRLSFPPHEMDLTVVRNTAEERVCAALGIPAAVVGFGTGLDTTKVGATLHEFVRLAWNNGLVPLQRLLAGELQRVLLPQFETDTERFQCGWDYDEVQSLQEDQNQLATRYTGLVTSGILKVSEARQALGYESDPEDEIYLRPTSVTPTDPADQMPEPEPVVVQAPMNGNGVTNGNGNGNGQGRRNVRQPAEQRALMKQTGSLEELIMAQINRRAGKMNHPPAALMRLAAKLWRAEQKLLPGFQDQIASVLKRYGTMVVTAAREVSVKQPNLEDVIQTSIITERAPTAVLKFELREVYEALYDTMAAMTVELLQDAMDLLVTDTPALQAQLRSVARERVRLLDLDAEARTNIANILEAARTEGWDEEQLGDALRVKVPSGRWTTPEIRATIMARSESRFAGNMAASSYAQQHGLGKVLVLDARLGPTDAECLPAGTAVMAIHPEMALCRWFEGDLIDIQTADGRFLSATRNHPILTRNGWVLADELQKGDEVVCCLDPQRLAMDATRQDCPNDEDMPASRQQRFHLSRIPLTARAIGQSFRTGNFNCQWDYPQVDAVLAARHLRNRNNASVIQPRPQKLFIGAIESAADFSGLSRFDHIAQALGPTTYRQMRRVGFSATLFRRELSIHECSSFGARAQGISSAVQGIFDVRTTDSQRPSNILERTATTVEGQSFFDINGLLKASSRDASSFKDTQDSKFADLEAGRQLYRTLASYVTCDKVISVHIRAFQGHVYNLRTRDGWYTANSIITHNCEIRNGWIVSPAEGQMLAGTEHPSGTLSLVPLSPSMVPSGEG